VRTPFSSPQARVAAGTLGMRLFLLSLGVLFGATVIGYISIRLMAIHEPLDLPKLPRGLWLSTVVLIASSVTIQGAVVAVRQGRPGRMRAGLASTTALGMTFLIVQASCWIAWAEPMRASLQQSEQRFLLTAFYVLTGLHAVHVIGGLVPLAVMTRRAYAGRGSDPQHAGVIYTAMYWHFLDAVWLVLFVTLLVGS